MAPTDSGILTDTLNTFLGRMAFGYNPLQNASLSLFTILISLEMATLGIWWAMSGSDQIGKLFKKILLIGFFSYVLNNYASLITIIIEGFTWTGRTASGTASQVDVTFDPSKILDKGIDIIEPVMISAAANIGWFGGGLITALMAFFSMAVILIAFTILALQVIICRIEFMMVCMLGFILIPFGINKHTSFLAERIFGAIISFGVKLMVLTFIINIAWPLMSDLSIDAANTDSYFPQIYTAVGAIVIAILSVHAPAVAAGMMSGAPSLTAGAFAPAAGAIGGAAATGLALAGGPIAAAAAAKFDNAVGAIRSGLGLGDGGRSGGGGGSLGGSSMASVSGGGSSLGSTVASGASSTSQSSSGFSGSSNGQGPLREQASEASRSQSSGSNGASKFYNDQDQSRFNRGSSQDETNTTKTANTEKGPSNTEQNKNSNSEKEKSSEQQGKGGDRGGKEESSDSQSSKRINEQVQDNVSGSRSLRQRLTSNISRATDLASRHLQSSSPSGSLQVSINRGED